MAYTSNLVEKNMPGYTQKEFTITLDGEGSIANLDYNSPEDQEPTAVRFYQKTAATDSSLIHPIATVDTTNAQVDLTFDTDGDTDGAVFVLTLEFPCGPDQDGTSTFGAGNTGKTFS